ncbi:RAMP superfamily CRISPR-associated protein [Paenibacillus sp. MSJ-34]|uniref:RAMP superfamily CRISPR-associated protein n=1 Tax=Paenibacillus sp. MSJ-34 TaxID=2841529 RepID=UPI001C10D662|nr:RAMP superfamily CRISPR-associated protein [Paenibacillus sp. MSJ-34]MBU5442522.1 hypothetical protein [Paenibacillus sp. MSJ-34]
MSVDTIHLKVTTLSNLFIGGSPATFEIGGVDLFTVTDYNGKPYIPASSFKGSLRKIVRDLARSDSDSANAKLIGQAYREYLRDLLQENMERLGRLEVENERISRMKERYEKEIESASAECLFGMEGFNHTPKLIFNDFQLLDSNHDPFSVDSKNTIEYYGAPEDPKISAKPRTYQTVRPGVEFAGEIHFYMIDKLTVSLDVIKQFIEHAIRQFNTGIYRLGNSGSRGYGKIQVEVIRRSDQFD